MTEEGAQATGPPQSPNPMQSRTAWVSVNRSTHKGNLGAVVNGDGGLVALCLYESPSVLKWIGGALVSS